MKLRSGFQKPCDIKLIRCPKGRGKNKQGKSPAYIFRARKKCYIQTEDSKTVRFDLDEHGNCNISVKDSQSSEDIAWLDIFTRYRQNDYAGKNLVTLTQKSNDAFLLLSKDSRNKRLYLKVLESQHEVTRQHMEEYTERLTEQRQENELFIMHANQENSVKFQCYKDKNYYLHVNKDSVNICKLEETDADGGKDFRFMVKYVKEAKFQKHGNVLCNPPQKANRKQK